MRPSSDDTLLLFMACLSKAGYDVKPLPVEVLISLGFDTEDGQEA